MKSLNIMKSNIRTFWLRPTLESLQLTQLTATHQWQLPLVNHSLDPLSSGSLSTPTPAHVIVESANNPVPCP